jgi:hypothetical protein
MGNGDMASVGAFIYCDDKHELDFEIGSGRADVRRQLKAADDELICYCTNQGFPYSTMQVKIRRGTWHTLTLALVPTAEKTLLARWSVDGRMVKELRTQLPDSTRFGIYCSVENLKFLGDHIPTGDNKAYFNTVSFTPFSAGSQLLVR